MRFIVDAQLPPALAGFIKNTGHEANHVTDFGLETASDRQIWQIALERGAIIVSKDEDFSRLGSIRGSGPAIVWVRSATRLATPSASSLFVFRRSLPHWKPAKPSSN